VGLLWGVQQGGGGGKKLWHKAKTGELLCGQTLIKRRNLYVFPFGKKK
jgi:hypothetical protein